MNMRSGRAARGGWGWFAIVLGAALLSAPAMAQVRHAGTMPDGRGGVVPLSVGDHNGCGLRADGTAQCWGYDGSSHRATPPAGTFVEISSGSEHSCGVRTDGTLACWGVYFSTSLARPPQGTFKAVSSSFNFSCGLRTEPAVGPSASNAQCWNSNGGMTMSPAAGNFVALTTGSWHACGLLGTGEIRCWKYDYGFDYGQALPPAGRFIAVTAGYAHTCGLRADGSVVCWGLNDNGQSTAPTEKFTAIDAGTSHTCGLRGDGKVQCWGANAFGQSTPPDEAFVAFVAGGTHTCGLRGDGHLTCWGDAFSGSTPPVDTTFGVGTLALGNGHGCHIGADGQLACWGYNPYGWNVPAGRFTDVSSGEAFSCARQDDGTNLCWGWNSNGEGQRDIPQQSLRRFDLGAMHGCAVQATGELTCWGSNNYGQTAPPTGLFRNSSGGLVHSCGVADDGHGVCWGYNYDGESNVPSLPAGVGYLAVDAGERHSCGLSSSGGLACWGATTASVPAGSFRALSAGGYHDCAIRADGTLACWGDNWSDQLEAPPGTFVSVSSGSNGSCAIRSDGVRVCWGGVASSLPLLMEPYQLQAAGIDRAYSTQFLLQSMPDAPALGASNFRVVAGALPPGLSLAADGALTGTPTTAGAYSVTVEGDGGNGFAVQKKYNLAIDNTPPTVMPQVTGTLGANGWYVGTNRLSWSIADNESSVTIVSGCDWLTLSTDQTARDYSCGVESAGGSASASVNLKVDVTAPTTALTATPGATSTSTTATFAFVGADATSGMSGFECSLDGAAYAGCASPYTAVVAVGSHSFNVRAVDAAGLRDQTPSSHSWKVDTTPPVIVAAQNGTLGDNGWYISAVDISWSVTDPDSAVTSTVGCNPVTLATDTPGASFTCTATSAGGTVSRTITVKRDTTKPVISAAPTTAANAAGWYNAAVTVAYVCSDALSGVVACPVNDVLSNEGASQSVVRTVKDVAGNQAVSNVVTIKIDRTAPTMAPTVTPGTLLLNASAAARANGNDILSGIASESCAALATSSVGNKTVGCTVTDVAGNSASGNAGYTVVYGFSGFSTPVQNPPVLNVFKAGRSIPLRWRVVDAQGAPVTNLSSAVVSATSIECPIATENRISVYGGNNGKLQNLGNGYYELDWMSASSLRGYCRVLDLNLGDGQSHPAQFKFN